MPWITGTRVSMTLIMSDKPFGIVRSMFFLLLLTLSKPQSIYVEKQQGTNKIKKSLLSLQQVGDRSPKSPTKRVMVLVKRFNNCFYHKSSRNEEKDLFQFCYKYDTILHKIFESAQRVQLLQRLMTGSALASLGLRPNKLKKHTKIL